LVCICRKQVWNWVQMGGIWDWVKVKFFPLHMIFGYVFVVSGLIVCFLMLLTYLFVWPFNKTLYRKIVVNLVYTHWCRKYTCTLIARSKALSSCLVISPPLA